MVLKKLRGEGGIKRQTFNTYTKDSEELKEVYREVTEWEEEQRKNKRQEKIQKGENLLKNIKKKDICIRK